MSDLYIIKDRLNEALKAREMTSQQLADKSGLYFTTIYRYLNGVRIPKTDSIEKMALALRVSPSWLLGYDVPMTPSEPTKTPDITYTKDELTILIEQLDAKDKEALIGIVKSLLGKSKEGDNGNTKV